jgi:hypothetical protein
LPAIGHWPWAIAFQLAKPAKGPTRVTIDRLLNVDNLRPATDNEQRATDNKRYRFISMAWWPPYGLGKSLPDMGAMNWGEGHHIKGEANEKKN